MESVAGDDKPRSSSLKPMPNISLNYLVWYRMLLGYFVQHFKSTENTREFLCTSCFLCTSLVFEHSFSTVKRWCGLDVLIAQLFPTTSRITISWLPIDGLNKTLKANKSYSLVEISFGVDDHITFTHDTLGTSCIAQENGIPLVVKQASNPT